MRIECAANGVVDGGPLRHDARHLSQEAQSDAAGDGIVAVNHLEDAPDELVHVDDLVEITLTTRVRG